MESDLNSLFIDVKTLLASSSEDYKNKQWATYPNFIAELNRILTRCKELDLSVDIEPVQQVPKRNLAGPRSVGMGTNAEKAKLREIVDKSRRLLALIEASIVNQKRSDQSTTPIDHIKEICNRFHLVARQLRHRRENRSTIEVNDEYDVQDLMHSLLLLFFDDIRTEEWTPSYAGGTSRMDFLLKNEKMVIEVKKTRQNLTDKELGEQLLIDITKYKQHYDCKTLICFIYDPEERIANPRGLENDLNKLSNDAMKIITIISPS